MDFIEVFPDALPAPLCAALIDVLEIHPGVRDGVTGAGFDPQKKRSKDLTMDSDPGLAAHILRLQPYTLAHVVTYVRRYPFVLIGGLTPTVRDPSTGAPVPVDVETFARLDDAQLTGLVKSLLRSGAVNLQKYSAGVGGYPHWHSEIYPQDRRCEPLHRVLFYLYYLNDVADGGQTEFFFQGRSIQPRRGTLVIAPAGFTHTHRGNTPSSGDKYIATSWLLFRRAEQLFPERA